MIRKKALRRARQIAEAGGVRLLTNQMLDKLTDEEMRRYLDDGRLPRFWKLRKG